MRVPDFIWRYMRGVSYRKMSRDTVYFGKGEIPDWEYKRDVCHFMMDCQIGHRSCGKSADIIVKAFKELRNENFRKNIIEMIEEAKFEYHDNGLETLFVSEKEFIRYRIKERLDEAIDKIMSEKGE